MENDIYLNVKITGLQNKCRKLTNSVNDLHKKVEYQCNLSVPGLDGNRGPRGKMGVTGSTGSTGMNGNIGNTGMTGDAGVTGPKGDTGSTGSIGLKGDTGNTGTKGNTGNIGMTGDIGATGSKGINGDTGNANTTTGNTGPTGNIGETGSKGTNGDTGAIGMTGDIGNTGIRGDTGDMGMTGDVGHIGQTGAIGPTGICSCVYETGCTSSVNNILGSTAPFGPTGDFIAYSVNGKQFTIWGRIYNNIISTPTNRIVDIPPEFINGRTVSCYSGKGNGMVYRTINNTKTQFREVAVNFNTDTAPTQIHIITSPPFGPIPNTIGILDYQITGFFV